MGDVLSNPWSEANSYDRFALAGVTFTGKVELDANELLKKKSDHRRSRGRNGGRSVSTGWDLVEFSVTLSAFDTQTFEQLQEIIRRVGRGAVAAQDRSALSVGHPYLAAVGISQVTLETLGFVPVVAGGALGLRLKLKEFRPPTQAPGARAPAAAGQGTETRPPAKVGGSIVPLGDRSEGVEIRNEGREIPIAARAPAAPATTP